MNSSEDQAISDLAVQYAKDHHKAIVKEITEQFSQEDNPISIFMGGSPGAGKTEASLRLLKNTENILRIDADELRNLFKECGYCGTNSHLFQKAATKLVHEMHDQALKKGISFLLDGTFASENMARQNIQRSLKRDRSVFVLYVYQSPLIAWGFVQQRELVEGRRIRPQDFAAKFCASREVVNKMKDEFGDEITVRLVCKNMDGSTKSYEKNVKCIDDHIPEKYDEAQILDKISSGQESDSDNVSF